MTKRQNPWRDDTPMQLKNHISVKEVANGIDGNIYKDELMDHTKQLLIVGAKKYYSQPEERQTLNNNIEKENIMSCCGQQQRSIMEFFNGSMKPQPEAKHEHKDSTLNGCEHISPVIKCEFCLKPTCLNCARVCANCNNQYCSNCSFLRYEGSADSAMCFSCK